MEADAPVTAAETILGRVDALEPLDVSGARFSEALDRLMDATSSSFIECGQIFQSLLGPFDLSHLRPSLRMASSWGMPRPPFCSIQSRAS